MADLHKARELAESGNLDEAWLIVDQALREDINDARALILTTFILEKTGKPTLAYHIAKMLTERFPNEWAGWLNLGRCADHIWLMDEAEKAYTKALGLAKNDKDRATTHVNLSAMFVQIGRFDDAIPHAELALSIKPDNRKARHNLGVSQLAAHDWANGWQNYSASIGSQYRPLFKYQDEPEWDGSWDKDVVIYGEQGLGDEINAASMFPDAIRNCRKVILDCDHRLVGLYKRSFPLARVYGTRTKHALNWAQDDQQIDASIACMELGKLYRTKDADFPGTAYLKPDPVRTFMWESLFRQKAKPVIGIAWSGGVDHTGARYRRLSLDDLVPLFNAIDAHWVSLQYKDAQPEIDAFFDRRRRPDVIQVHDLPSAAFQVPGRDAPEGGILLPGLPRGAHAQDQTKLQRIEPGPKAQGERSVLRESLQRAWQDDAAAVRGMRSAGLTDASRGLQPAAASVLAVPDAPSGHASGIDLVQYPHATLTQDYDDTAALVAACDLVICMQTAVAHLAGALGKECWVFLPRNSQWRYGSSGTTIPWYQSVQVIRQRKAGVWTDVIHDTSLRLDAKFNRRAA